MGGVGLGYCRLGVGFLGYCAPGDAVRLARVGHALTDNDFGCLVASHDHLSRRVCPRLPAKVNDMTEECTRVMDPCPRCHRGAGRSVARKRAGGALPLAAGYLASMLHARSRRSSSKKCLVVQQSWPRGLTRAASVGYDLFIMRRFVLILSSRSGT